MSTIKVNSIEPANAGSEDYFLARAWVNFNGTGTVATRDSGNVSSLTDNGTGSYNVNFSNAFANLNGASVGASFASGIAWAASPQCYFLTSSAARYAVANSTNFSSVDTDINGYTAHGDLA